MREEYDLAVSVGRRLGVVENLFTHMGVPGHELVLVHEASPADPAACRFDRLPSRDAEGVAAVWRSPADADVPLYPAGAAELVGFGRT
jgi:hypothetical protein